MAVSLLIGADVAPVGTSVDSFASGDLSCLMDAEILSLWEKSDLRVFDLEIPFTDSVEPIRKCGPTLRAPKRAFRGIASLGASPCFVTLANNHILDMDVQGLKETISLLRSSHIDFGGAGDNAEEASRPVFMRIHEEEIGFLCCCETEFSGAGAHSPGAALFDPLETPDAVAEAKKKCDHLIVLYHGGPEEWPYPTPALQKRLRKLIDKGADAVFCQHGHIVGCMETYRERPIVYGQGNFLFPAEDGAACWKDGLLIELILEKDVRPVLRFHPIVSRGIGKRVANQQENAFIMNAFSKRSEEILHPETVKLRTRERAETLSGQLGRALLGNSFLLKALNVLTGRRPLDRFYDNDARLRLIDFFQCETLRELFLTALDEKKGETYDAGADQK